MKNKIWLILVFQTIAIVTLFGQENNFSDSILEDTPDSTMFNMHLDSIYKYCYEDHQKLTFHIEESKKLLSKGLELSKNTQLSFSIKMIDYELSQLNYIKAYQLLKDTKHLIEIKDISQKLKNEYYYTEGYILMHLGDLEFAQKSYYKLLEKAEEQKDTFLSIQALYSLGQLFVGEKDYENSEKYFLKTNKIEQDFFKDKKDLAYTYLELSNLYIQKKDYEKASFYNDMGLNSIDEYQKSIKISFTLNQGEIALKRDKIFAAQNAYNSAFQVATELQSKTELDFCKEFEASILNAQGEHEKALTIYEGFIAEDHKESLLNTLEWYKEAHETSEKLGDFKKAYQYMVEANTIKDSMANEKKMQQTAFLKIKFDSDQKEKENHVLAVQVSQKNSQNKFLYAIATLFLFGLLVVFGAFFQKRKYNLRLKEEVEKRTKDLENANNLLSKSYEELDQFNKILSHDLKEPLRSIVGFSTLAKKKISAESKIGEYLNIIGNSGKQLHQLIEDVSVFQKIGNDAKKPAEDANIQGMMNDIVESVSILLMEKKGKVTFHNLPTVKTHKLFLFLVFKNLIENGLKYNESLFPLIKVTYFEQNKTHFFQFKDNGIGIAPQFQDRVFGMFKRLNDRGTYSGSGLGLSICKKMIGKLNGDICIIQSEEGQGSTFQVSFPFMEQQIDQDKLFMELSIPDSN
ncbi:MAG: ATP-binding protein [Saprospiraceae bacterium]